MVFILQLCSFAEVLLAHPGKSGAAGCDRFHRLSTEHMQLDRQLRYNWLLGMICRLATS